MSTDTPLTLFDVGEKPSKWIRSAVFTSLHPDWGTSPDLMDELDEEFAFNLDPCPFGGNDGLTVDWKGRRVFCNPPYGHGLAAWLRKGPTADVAVYLLPARTDTQWFHELCLPIAKEIRFIRGRLRFVDGSATKRNGQDAAPFPSMLVVFRAPESTGSNSLAPVGGKPEACSKSSSNSDVRDNPEVKRE